MKYLSITIWLFVHLISLSYAQDSFYYYHGERIELTPSDNEFYVTFKKDVDKTKKRKALNKGKRFATQSNESFVGRSIRISTSNNLSKTERESFLDSLSQDESISSVHPTYRTPDGDTIYVKDDVIFQPKDDNFIDVVKSFNAEIIEIISLGSNKQVVIKSTTGQSAIDLANALFESGLVVFAQPNFTFQCSASISRIKSDNTTLALSPNDPYYSTKQWFLNNTGQNGGTPGADISAEEAWEITQGSESVVVAVMDGSGYDLEHPEFSGKFVSPYDAAGSDGNSPDDDPSPENSYANHGTPCAGIICALTNNNKGVASVGVNIKVQPINIGYSNYNGGFQTNDATISRAASKIIATPGVVAVSNSWGGGTKNESLENSYHSIRTQSRDGKGAVILFSSGNSGTNGVGYPARADNIIAVGATENNDKRTYFSQYGTDLDVVAPGSDIYTLDRQDGLLKQGYNWGDYVSFSGTSAACPIAAAVVGLMASQNPNLTASELENYLQQTCDKTGGYTYSQVSSRTLGTWNTEMGYGRVNAYKAVLAAGSISVPNAPTNLTAQVESSSQVNLSWQDNSDNEMGFIIHWSKYANFSTYDSTFQGRDRTSHPLSGLEANTTYYFRVYASSLAGNSAFSNTVSETTQPEGSIPQPPTGLQATAISEKRIRLNWIDNANNELGFYLHRSKTSNFSAYTEIPAGYENDTEYNDNNLEPNTTYYYRLTASNGYGRSDFSNTASATTSDAPIEFFSDDFEEDNLTSIWQYEVYDAQNPSRSSEQSVSPTHSVKITQGETTSSHSALIKNLDSGSDDFYFEMSIYVPSTFVGPSDILVLRNTTSSDSRYDFFGTWSVSLKLRQDNIMELARNVSFDRSHTYVGEFSYPRDTWFKIGLLYQGNNINGGIEFYVNDEFKKSEGEVWSPIWNTSGQTIKQIMVGIVDDAGANSNIYIDNIRAYTQSPQSLIGPEKRYHCNISASSGTYSDIDNKAGILESAIDGFEPASDIPKPPHAPNGYISLAFTHPEWGIDEYDKFMYDVRSSNSIGSKAKHWPFEVSTDQTSTEVLLSFELQDIPSGFGVTCVDKETGILTNLRNSPEYSYPAQALRAFVLSIGDSTKPEIMLTTPSGGETFFQGDTIQIAWQASDASGLLAHRLYATPFSSGEKMLIAEVAGSKSFYNWTIPTSLIGAVSLSITSIDSVFNETEVFLEKDIVLERERANVFLPGWTLMSIPFLPTNSTSDSVLGQFVPNYYYLFDYTQQSGFSISETVQLAQGYWFTSPDTVRVEMTGEGQDTSSLKLQAGWNVVGNALYEFVPKAALKVEKNGQIESFDEAVKQDWLSAACYGFTAGASSYSETDTLKPWAGYWLAAIDSNLTLIFDINSIGSKTLQSQQLMTQATSTNWKVQLYATAINSSDSISFCGTNNSATDAFDSEFDMPEPPLPPTKNTIRLYFSQEDWPEVLGNKYNADVRAPLAEQESKQWNFEVEYTGDVTLSWSTPNLSGLSLILEDESNAQTINMLATSEYSYTASEAEPIHKFSIKATQEISSVEDKAEVLPYKYTLQQNYPNPFNPTTTIRFSLKEAGTAILKVFDVLGREILVEHIAGKVGWNSYVFKANEISSGMYFYQLRAGEFSEMKKMLLLR
ncbi:peptidase S8 and S53 subtilisin kexin sedolisin [Chloroherpeton thalassium ATCC 35110]|uniref:Peptidase S8 and S53 subtilisin kexin sedolisin n=1 Tax=Chloroherpeton thalassium (strain ATCC 35110 / GB-78) TaxID=517418 RepID=B3QY67_CHLT3|nr:S8 family serine peptidase [Chloroherpeton thalassium]ACF15033.1 peptidase S8 and S53 subtilisin kexin sedolisin [Chloroherpeton thalassium ATCC 35110]